MLNTISAILANGVSAVGDYESIQTYTVGAGGAASIDFTSISGAYSHLQLRMISRSTGSVSSIAQWAKFNSDAGNNYFPYHLLYGNGSAAASTAGTTSNQILFGDSTGATAAANIFATSVVDILDYSKTNKNKTTRCLYGFDLNGGGTSGFTSGLWMNTAAITSISITSGSGNFAQYSQFALYGVK